MAGMLVTCQPGFERHLAGELAASGGLPPEQGSGWVRAGSGRPPGDLAFAHCLLPEPVELRAGSVNAMAAAVSRWFAAAVGGERIDTPWPCLWWAPGSGAGIARRAAVVEREFLALLRRRMARVARLAEPGRLPRPGAARGLFAAFVDFDRAFVARAAVLGGQRRMADDPAAPSRSYLKIEEAYGVLGVEPEAGQTVADLGAAPGGWSYSAAKRGARVTAVDNGPLKGGARGHPLIQHRRLDAFDFRPEPGEGFDWLFCDLVAEPHHVLRGIVTPWLAQRWCRRFVVNLKFGRADPVTLLAELRAPASPLAAHASGCRVRHLYHDREELTVVGWR